MADVLMRQIPDDKLLEVLGAQSPGQDHATRAAGAIHNDVLCAYTALKYGFCMAMRAMQ